MSDSFKSNDLNKNTVFHRALYISRIPFGKNISGKNISGKKKDSISW